MVEFVKYCDRKWNLLIVTVSPTLRSAEPGLCTFTRRITLAYFFTIQRWQFEYYQNFTSNNFQVCLIAIHSFIWIGFVTIPWKTYLENGALLILKGLSLLRSILHKHKIDFYLYTQWNNIMTSHACSILIYYYLIVFRVWFFTTTYKNSSRISANISECKSVLWPN